MTKPRDALDNLTDAMVDDIKHALGLTRSDSAYRNYYAESLNNTDHMDRMVEMGLMRHGHWTGNLQYYHVTDAGMRAAGLFPNKINRELERLR